MLNKGHLLFILFLLCTICAQKTYAQEVRVIDNKGTLKTVNNNTVTSAATAPGAPFKGDVWVDTSTTPNTINIYDGATWINSSHIGTTGSVFFAGTDGKPAENNSQLFFDNTSTTKKLGIGTNSPTNKLEVAGAIGTQGILNSDGNAGEPAFRFKDDTNTGMYSPAADEIGFSVGSFEALLIDELTTGNTVVTVKQTLELDGQVLDESNTVGTLGQVLTATATGTNWVDPSTINTDDQKIDVYALNADGKNLDLSIEADGETTKQTDLSALNIAGDVTGTLAASKVEKIQNTQVSVTAPTDGQILTYNTTASEWQPKTATNWNITGNSGTTAANFLGTIDDKKMQIRSFDIPMLEFGRRETLGLDETLPDYDDLDQPLVHLNGNGNVAALQFAAAGASFYKPMFFTTTNGSFRLKGSSGGTDLFEIGSAGPANDGRLEFIIGDDGPEPIIFKRYDYRNGRFHKEFFRVQGSDGSANAKTRFGININTAQVPVDLDFDDPQSGFNVANSTLQINGSVSKSIFTTSAALALDEDYHTIVLGGNHSITLPAANTCLGRVYVIKNPNTYATSITAYINEQGVTGIVTVNSTSTLWLQSDGTNWQQISNSGAAAAASPGDIKQGIQTANHDGWYLLDGSAIASLPAGAQANATTLGLSGNLPNAADRVLKNKIGSEAMFSTGGIANTTLTQANLPNVNFTGTTTTNGAHTHTIGQSSFSAGVSGWLSTTTNVILNSGSTTTSSNGNHNHNVTVASGGSNTSFTNYQPYLVVNTFIYLGL